MARLTVGEKAPAFDIETQKGTVSLDSLLEQSDKGVIVYFYPKASTPGCTTEACDFNEADLGYTIIGISPDKMPAIEKFAEKYDLGFYLGSDPDKKVLEAYGAWGEKKNYGKVIVGVIRSTIIVGKDGLVQDAMYNVKATGHVGRVTKNLIGN